MAQLIGQIHPKKILRKGRRGYVWFKRFDEWAGHKNGVSAFESFDDILTHFFGVNPNPNESWLNLGLSSMISMQLIDVISDRFCVRLPSDCFELYPTAAHLKDFVMNSQGTPIPTKLPTLDRLLPSAAISWLTMGIVQAFGAALLLLLFAIPIIPAWFMGKAVYGNEALIVAVGDHMWIQWIWLPVAVPTWMVSFSLCVVLAKWTVVGRYRECEMAIPSIAYLQWWWVDRALHLWEFWVGLYIKDTLLLLWPRSILASNSKPSFASLISWRSRKKRLLTTTYTAESLDHRKTEKRARDSAFSEFMRKRIASSVGC
jgi:acyl carrier protein